MIWKLSERKDWNSLEQQFGWVRDMNQVPQHTVHHAEGSVAVHTRMVLEALLRQPAYLMLPEQEREILWAAALLHDVEKRSRYTCSFQYTRAYSFTGTPSWSAYLVDGTRRSFKACL